MAAVVVTYHRKDVLRQWLEALQNQTRPVDQIIVVDNGGTDGTGQMIKDNFPGVIYLSMGENIGPAGGFSRGMQEAYSRGYDWVWVFNDDALADEKALEACLKIGQAQDDPEKVGIVWPASRGSVQRGYMWRGKPTPKKLSGGSDPYEVDLVTFNGALISREAIKTIGYPRQEYFFGFWEWEYCLRVKAAGLQIWISPEVAIDNLALGSAQRAASPWRGYYQTRNHLNLVLERRSVYELLWWCVRQVNFSLRTVLYLDSKYERLRLRALGAWHGLRGHLGRTIDPSSYSTN